MCYHTQDDGSFILGFIAHPGVDAGLQVEQWHVVSPLDQQLVNLWAIVDAHRKEDPDFKVGC